MGLDDVGLHIYDQFFEYLKEMLFFLYRELHNPFEVKILLGMIRPDLRFP